MKTKSISAETFCRNEYPEAFLFSRPSGDARIFFVCRLVNGEIMSICEGCFYKNEAWSTLKKNLTHIPFKKEIDRSTRFKKLLDSFSDTVTISYSGENGFTIRWSEKGRGFGEYTFFKDKKKGWVLDNECDSRETVARVLSNLVMSLPLTDEEHG